MMMTIADLIDIVVKIILITITITTEMKEMTGIAIAVTTTEIEIAAKTTEIEIAAMTTGIAMSAMTTGIEIAMSAMMMNEIGIIDLLPENRTVLVVSMIITKIHAMLTGTDFYIFLNLFFCFLIVESA